MTMTCTQNDKQYDLGLWQPRCEDTHYELKSGSFEPTPNGTWLSPAIRKYLDSSRIFAVLLSKPNRTSEDPNIWCKFEKNPSGSCYVNLEQDHTKDLYDEQGVSASECAHECSIRAEKLKVTQVANAFISAYYDGECLKGPSIPRQHYNERDAHQQAGFYRLTYEVEKIQEPSGGVTFALGDELRSYFSTAKEFTISNQSSQGSPSFSCIFSENESKWHDFLTRSSKDTCHIISNSENNPSFSAPQANAEACLNVCITEARKYTFHPTSSFYASAKKIDKWPDDECPLLPQGAEGTHILGMAALSVIAAVGLGYGAMKAYQYLRQRM